MILRENTICNIVLTVYTTSTSKVDIVKLITELLEKGYSFMVLKGTVMIKESTSTAYKVKFSIKCDSTASTEDVECLLKPKILSLDPSIRKVENILVEPLKDELLTDVLAPRICAKCGAKMVIKTGYKGQFYGCSTFPKCRYTENI